MTNKIVARKEMTSKVQLVYEQAENGKDFIVKIDITTPIREGKWTFDECADEIDRLHKRQEQIVRLAVESLESKKTVEEFIRALWLEEEENAVESLDNKKTAEEFIRALWLEEKENEDENK